MSKCGAFCRFHSLSGVSQLSVWSSFCHISVACLISLCHLSAIYLTPIYCTPSAKYLSFCCILSFSHISVMSSIFQSYLCNVFYLSVIYFVICLLSFRLITALCLIDVLHLCYCTELRKRQLLLHPLPHPHQQLSFASLSDIPPPRPQWSPSISLIEALILIWETLYVPKTHICRI